MSADVYFGDRSGVDLRAFQNGVYVSGWYDTYVGIEGGFLTWDELDKLRAKARRRAAYGMTAGSPAGADQARGE